MLRAWCRPSGVRRRLQGRGTRGRFDEVSEDFGSKAGPVRLFLDRLRVFKVTRVEAELLAGPKHHPRLLALCVHAAPCSCAQCVPSHLCMRQPRARKGSEVSTLAVRSCHVASPGASPEGCSMSPTRSTTPPSRWRSPAGTGSAPPGTQAPAAEAASAPSTDWRSVGGAASGDPASCAFRRAASPLPCCPCVSCCACCCSCSCLGCGCRGGGCSGLTVRGADAAPVARAEV